MLDGIKLFSIYMEIFGILHLVDLILGHRCIYGLGIHPYEFGYMSMNNISISRIMYSKCQQNVK